MSTKVGGWLGVAIWVTWLTACSPIGMTPPASLATVVPISTTEAEEVEVEMPNQDDLVALAQADLAARLGVGVDQIVVRGVKKVTWPDTSLGCPQPDMMYAQVEQVGLLIQLSVGGATYRYHSGAAQAPFLCEASSLLAPPPQDDELVPPPDRDID